MLTFGHTLEALEENSDIASKTFGDKAELFKDLGGRNAPIKKKMYFIVAGTFNDQAAKLMKSDNWKKLIDNDRGYKIQFIPVDIDDIVNQIVSPQTKALKIKFDGHVIKRKDELTGKQTVVGYVKATDFVPIVQQNPGLFGLNVR